ncbi:ATP-binding protein [Photobacterium leiognathi]|uniref:ATP-binding protein n=1 Tax=Photobacterium leiognathi TaxID=553611 RepID=UPI002980FECF|nr:sensor histidine kinase [Photobacterium leiognathi]
MKFQVSTGLKSIIGKDLITDDFVAIFELVKNSFDAYANNVEITFLEDEIVISDNGKGMSYDDLVNKWLFVAYSAKADDSEDVSLSKDYRANLRAKRAHYAGNKGVGRFSCDRLGRDLVIQTKSDECEKVHQITLSWDDFELNQKDKFDSVNVAYQEANDFDCPNDSRLKVKSSGTVLVIKHLRDKDSWSRHKLVRLKSALAKLIDPFGMKNDFDVIISAPKELDKDKENLSKVSKDSVDSDSPYIDVVNGKVRNLVFDKISEKTTRIKVNISKSGDDIETILIDRGELVYKIREKNNYNLLSKADVNIEIYYMNTAAKNNFTRTMGIPSVQFGSIFLFNNGFRVFPIGEPNDDTLGLNSRKTQGYGRYLGTREILGIIEVVGDSTKFKEASSRDKGFVVTASSQQLFKFFYDHALKRLEAYVSKVSWPDKLDAESDNLSRILTDQGKSRVVKVISKLATSKDVEIIDYSERLVDIVSIRNSNFSEVINDLQQFVSKSGSESLQERIEIALNQYRELKEAEKQSREEAELERKLRLEAEEEARKEREAKLVELEKNKELQKNLDDSAEKLEIVEEALQEEKKRSLFLKKASSVDIETVRNFHHQIGIYSSSINHLIQLKLDSLRAGKEMSTQEISQILESISFKNQQILTVSRIATVADYRLSAEEIDEDLVFFAREYLEEVVSKYSPDIDVEWISDGHEWDMTFMPLEVMLVVDNLVHNASKPNTGCTKITFSSSVTDKKRMEIEVYDDGLGFAPHLKLDIESIFDMGVTTTDGSGLGLYHVKQVINEMGGSIEADPTYENGAKFIIRFAK